MTEIAVQDTIASKPSWSDATLYWRCDYQTYAYLRFIRKYFFIDRRRRAQHRRWAAKRPENRIVPKPVYLHAYDGWYNRRGDLYDTKWLQMFNQARYPSQAPVLPFPQHVVNQIRQEAEQIFNSLEEAGEINLKHKLDAKVKLFLTA